MSHPYLEHLVMSPDVAVGVRRWALREWVLRSPLRWRLTLDYLFYEFGCDTLSSRPTVQQQALHLGLEDAMRYLIALDTERLAATDEYRQRRTAAKRNGDWRQPGKADPQPGFPAFANLDRHFVVVGCATARPEFAAPTRELFVEMKSPLPCSMYEPSLADKRAVAAAATRLQTSVVWLFVLDRATFGPHETEHDGLATYPGQPTLTAAQISRYTHLYHSRTVQGLPASSSASQA